MEQRPSLILRRRLRAPPRRVFEAWTQPAQLSRWFGPQQAEAVTAEIDLRVGGAFHIGFKAPDGSRNDVSGTYREIEPYRRLVFSWAWQTTPERQSRVTVLLDDEGGGTVLTLTHEQLFDEAARDRHAAGWRASLDRLAALFV
jgi:uncharacterized protein YndB with AHSA1/START domain